MIDFFCLTKKLSEKKEILQKTRKLKKLTLLCLLFLFIIEDCSTTWQNVEDERRTILWKKEVDKAVVKERQRLKELERVKSKGKSKKYVR